MIENKYACESIRTVIERGEAYNDLFILYGKIDQNMVNSSISIIESKLLNLNFSKTLISKAKLLSVEIIQNIFKHQYSHPSLSPYFYIAFCNNSLKLVSGNSVSLNDCHFLDEKFSKYKLLSTQELKKLYIDKLSKGELTNTGDAGLGLLTILSRSDKNSNHTLNKVSENEYHFGLEVNICNNN